MIGENRRYARSAEVVEAEVDGKVTLLHIADWRYFALDTPASAIWSMLEAPMGIDEIVERLTERFDVSAEQCRTDTLVFLKGLIATGAIVDRTSVH